MTQWTHSVDTSQVASVPRKVVGRSPATALDYLMQGDRGGESMPWGYRRWEGADLDRLNKAHWARAYRSRSINEDIAERLETIAARVNYEIGNNSILAGIVNTYADDVVGPDGPTVRVICDDDEYARAEEQVWNWWFRSPTPDWRVSGTAMLKMWLRGMWARGELLGRSVTAGAPDDPVRMRILPIPPRNLATPATYAADSSLFMGIRVDRRFNTPLEYYLLRQSPWSLGVLQTEWDGVPSEFIWHEYIRWEEDQLRGVPWASHGLQAIADLRDFDAEVLEVARQSASMGIVWKTNHPQSAFADLKAPESYPMRRGMQYTGPPGWEPLVVNPQQPAPQYVAYRRERHTELGRSQGMTAMHARGDASQHSFISARFEHVRYRSALQSIQSWLSGSDKSYGMLNRLFDSVIREASLTTPALRRPPRGRYVRMWTWAPPPSVDDEAEAKAQRVRLENGTLPFASACALGGLDEEAVFESEARTNRLRERLGLDPLPAPGSYLSRSAPAASGEADPKQEKDRDKPRTPDQEEETDDD